jgi:serum/glucocorticoid-regulated kinase 2
MSWAKLGKKSRPALAPDEMMPRSTTPTPGNPTGEPILRSGQISFRVIGAEGLSLPAGIQTPSAVEAALSSQQAKLAESISPSSVTQQRLAHKSRGSRESVQRIGIWFLPYLVVGYEVNQTVITPVGGSLAKPTYAYPAHFDVTVQEEVAIYAYLRREEPKSADGMQDSMGANDICLGVAKFVPNLDQMGSADEWYEFSNGTGRIQIGWSYTPANKSLTIDDFELITVIGKGSFGKVMQVKKSDTGRIYAMKTISKAHIVDRNEITHTLAERMVLERVNCPFIVPLKFSFQSKQKLYLVLAFVNGGELFHHLQQEQRFSEERSRFYSAELLLALEHLHTLDVVYRDLKPENILLDYNGHIALCDFGLCKVNMKDGNRTNTFCGTPEYLAPEILSGHGYDRTIDWWTLGILLYEMMAGLPPFYDERTDKMYDKILHDPLIFPEDFTDEACSILTGLINRDPTQRLGRQGAEAIKAHPFFKKYIDFDALVQKKIQPPFKPRVTSPVDVSNFDAEFTAETPMDSYKEGPQLSQTVQDQFYGFSYNGASNMAAA